MITEKQIESNRANAAKSTGPRTPTGKAVVSMNAMKHGLRSANAVLPTVESEEEYQEHRDRVFADLAPVGYMEEMLADRVASLTWRLNRVARFESQATAAFMEQAERDVAQQDLAWSPTISLAESPLAKAKAEADTLDKCLRHLEGLPNLKDDEPMEDGYLVCAAVVAVATHEDMARRNHFMLAIRQQLRYWHEVETAGQVRGVIPELCPEAAQADPTEMQWFMDRVLASVREWTEQAKAQFAGLRRELDCQLRVRLLPDENNVQKVTRYESHLERSMYRALQEFQRRQQKRLAGKDAPAKREPKRESSKASALSEAPPADAGQ